MLAVDPGGTTGMAAYLSNSEAEAHEAWEVEGQWEACDYVRTWVQQDLDVLVCESFYIGPQTLQKSRAGSLMAIEIIGTCRWLATCAGVPFVLQAPADAAMFVTPEKLRALGWWTKGSDHARSASKHLALYLIRNNIIDAHRLTPTPPDC